MVSAFRIQQYFWCREYCLWEAHLAIQLFRLCQQAIEILFLLICYYSGIRLINPRLINPAAYYIQFAWNGIVLCILENAVY